MPIEYLTSQVIAHINDRFDDLESLKLSHNGLLMAIVYSVMVGNIFNNCTLHHPNSRYQKDW